MLPQWCIVGSGWLDAIATDVILTIALKSLFVLRVRAIWSNNCIISWALYSLTTGKFSLVTVYKNVSQIRVMVLQQKSCVIRGFTTTVEAVLILARFMVSFKETRARSHTLRQHLAQVRVFTPLLYVFYRDGTLLFIPIWVITILEFASVFTGDGMAGNWSIWLAVAYGMTGAHLILNVRRAGCSLDESMLSRPLESLLPEFESGSANATGHSSR
ncbi:hypothetical protein NP233_g11085 [Leucocoprinus birnbaumii]|uniref:Uncharacterized protein n=1 Tax=Leucocoprinus birnbaumii TaxID=56174 RepID=A0AAD5VN45_9AGAR|nr:hypothetical protein NP233_g11085 [Leucocoprinus birnbaumii]